MGVTQSEAACQVNQVQEPRRGARRRRRVGGMLAIACLTAASVGCTGQNVQDFGDYFNFRNSFLNPAEVGRFDKANPFGKVQPVTWPILETLDVVETPADLWASATEPTPADIVAENKEFKVGPGDTVRLSIYDLQEPGREWTKDTIVSEAGTVDILYLGSVKIAGLTPSQADEKIGQIAIQNHALLPRGNGSAGPQVSVTVLQSRDRVFSLLGLGTVSRPGTYNIIGSDFRVLDALALAGDIQVQPGLDYLYIIRSTAKQTTAGPAVDETGTTAPPPPPTGNPLEAIESIEKNTTRPSTGPASGPSTAPSTAPMGPGAMGPQFLRPLPTVASNSTGAQGTLVQADLDAVMSTGSTASTSTTTSAPATGPAATAPGGDDLLNRAIEPPSGNHAMIGGKWVALPPATAPGGTATMPGGTGTVPGASPAGTAGAPAAGASPGAFAEAEALNGQRVIRIPISALRAGDPRYNIIIKPGDKINVPPVEQGEFYMMGHVARPGVFSLTGRKITLKMAVAAAGSLDALAIPRRCEITRRIGTNQEATVQVNLQAIFDGEQPDIFLKSNDVVNVGTDAIAPFLAVTRNAYRLSYGFGFVYDRNFFIQPTAVAK